MGKWLAGAAEVVITPPVGADLTGFGGRPSGATGVHDDLYARALAVEADGVRAALVTTDLLGLDFRLVGQIRDLVGEQCGIPPERLLLNSSHTHSGPASILLRGLGMADSAYLDVLVRQIAGAVRMACDRLAPAALSFGTAPARVGINRREKRPDGQVILGRNPDGPLDPTVYVLRADGEDGTPVALLFSHAAHPVTLGGSNLEITADYPGVAACVLRRIETRRGAAPVAMFAQGCCGNINSEPVGGTFEGARRLGTTLGAAAAVASGCARPLPGQGIASALETITLPFLPAPPVAEAQELVASARAVLARAETAGVHRGQRQLHEAGLAWAEDTLRAAQEPERYPGQAFEVHALAIGEAAFVGLPGEVFIELALDIQARSPFAHTVVLGYSNGCIGYVPTAAAYPDGGYEVAGAYRYYGTLMIAPEGERLITDSAVRLLGTLA